MKKHSFAFLLPLLALSTAGFAVEDLKIGIVNFESCITESSYGQREQDNVKNIHKQLTSLIENSEKEIQEIASKFEDADFLDSLSPKAEEELKLKFQSLQEDHARYQGQFYQILQNAHTQLLHNMRHKITHAASAIAQQKNLDYVLSKEACFYVRTDLDCTPNVIAELDRTFEAEQAKLKAENSEVTEAAPADLGQ